MTAIWRKKVADSWEAVTVGRRGASGPASRNARPPPPVARARRPAGASLVAVRSRRSGDVGNEPHVPGRLEGREPPAAVLDQLVLAHLSAGRADRALPPAAVLDQLVLA